MVRRYYRTGGTNVGDPAINSISITDPYFIDKTVTGVFKEGFRYYVPGVEWTWEAGSDTVNLVNVPTLEINEVIEIEVKLQVQFTEEDCSSLYSGGSANYLPDPYLPDIINCIVGRMDEYFSTRAEDPFNVSFNAGIYSQVTRDLYLEQTGVVNPQAKPLVWLVMPYVEQRAKVLGIYSNVTCSIILAVTTKNQYTQSERRDLNFKPRLLPMYQQFMWEVSRERKLQNSLIQKTANTPIQRPYWGGGDSATSNTPNLFKGFVDAIEIRGLQLNLKRAKIPCIN